jgi:hypothetical protein
MSEWRMYQPGLLYAAFDLMRAPDLMRKVPDLLVPGVRFIHDRAARVDTTAQAVNRRRQATRL